MSGDRSPGAGYSLKVTTYLTLLHPGSFYPEDEVRAVTGRDPERDAREAAPGVFAFSYHDIASTVAYVDGQPVTLSSRPVRKSPLHYVDAGELAADDVAALPGDHSILLANMRGNGWETVLRCRTGNFRPREAGDVIIGTRGATEGRPAE